MTSGSSNHGFAKRALFHGIAAAAILVAPILGCHLVLARLDHREWMYPTDAPRVVVPGAGQLRILIIGDSAAAGFGVRTHQLGVAGYLARRLASHTGRGVDIQIEAAISMTARGAPQLIEAAAAHSYDAIILMLATNDAMSLTAHDTWRRNMSRSLALLQSIAPSSGFVTTVADVGAFGRLAPLTRLICGRHAQVLNRTLAQLCARTGHTLTHLDPAQSLDSSTYRKWANSIATSLVSTIEPALARLLSPAFAPVRPGCASVA